MTRTHILLVEDNPDDAELTTAALKVHVPDVEVTWAEDGVEALERLESGPLPDVVLLDLKMPRVDGHQVLERLRANPRTRRLPVVILTSSSEEQDLARSYDAGASSYVVKPVDFDQFAQVAERIGVYWLRLNERAPPVRDS